MPSFWSLSQEEALAEQQSAAAGLSGVEAAGRLARYGDRRLHPKRRSVLHMLVSQVFNPLVLLLLAAGAISALVGSPEDALIILGIVLASGGLGFVQEYAAEDAVAKLLALVRTRATVRRDGQPVEIPAEEVVPGDVVLLSAGATVPGDARLLTANGLQVDESALTGESFPASKAVDSVADDAPAGRRRSAVFQGTHVVSGAAEALVMRIGRDTELGHISSRLNDRRPPTDFDLGLHRFGNLLVRVSAVLVVLVFAVNVVYHRPMLEAFLFSVALAVGLVPEMLPAIVTVTLARGARRLAEAEVVVKRLAAIEELGSFGVLCSDKTGTLTAGRIRLADALGPDGQPSVRARELGWLNATFESGYANPIDAALRVAHAGEPDGWRRLGEIPYDFSRKRLSVILEREGRRWLILKGQLEAVLKVCVSAEGPQGAGPLEEALDGVRVAHGRLAEEGKRVLGVAIRELAVEEALEDPALERDMTLAGLLAFTDPPKDDVPEVLRQLDGLGLSLKLLTGDDHRAARHLWRTLRGADPAILTGAELHQLGTEALQRRVGDVDVFAEVDPAQKERVVHALRAAGHGVAFLGDGINDAPALRAADVGITVEGASDVAREAADVVLRRHDLSVVANGVREGRRTMANTLKYVYYTTSANFGNMVSMAFASLFLPFLPLLPKQILLNNFLSDIPALAIASDRVDGDRLARPGRWNTGELRAFMVLFGSISSIFDIATFLLLMWITRSTEAMFRTGWFVESLLTELFVLLVLRTHLPMWRSRPGAGVLWSTVAVAGLTLILPYLPIGGIFGLEPMPPLLLGAVVAITATYVAVTEIAKQRFFLRRPR